MRRSIVAIVAVAAALAGGIALGAGPLSQDAPETGGAPTSTATSSEDPTTSPEQALAAAGESFAAETGPALVDGRLSGQRVSIVAMPGAPDDVVSHLADLVGTAGGEVASTFTVEPNALDASGRALVDTLGVQLAKQLESGVDRSDPTYVRLGAMVGLSVGTTSTKAAEPSADQQTARASLVTAKLASIDGGETAAPLVLVVLGDPVDEAILSGFVEGLRATVHGLVVAGSTASGAEGDLDALRQALTAAAVDAVATVDGDDTAIGQIVAILALVRQITGGGGAFGASGVDGFQPLA